MAAELNGDVSKPTPQPSADERFQKITDKALDADGRPEAQKLRTFLEGIWLGEPLHAPLTDLPVEALSFPDRGQQTFRASGRRRF